MAEFELSSIVVLANRKFSCSWNLQDRNKKLRIFLREGQNRYEDATHTKDMEDDEPRKTKKTKKDADIAKDVIEVLSDEEDEGEEKGVIIDEGDGSEKEPPKKRVKRGNEEKEPKGEASEKSEDSDGADEKSDVGKEDGEAEEREEDEEDEEDEDKEIDAKDIKKMKKEMAIPTKGPNKNIAPPSDIYASDLMCPDCQIPNQDFEEGKQIFFDRFHPLQILN